jgi:predicted membrane-bound dolichyl-phosphate-mannose-protein mannosyltransferase
MRKLLTTLILLAAVLLPAAQVSAETVPVAVKNADFASWNAKSGLPSGFGAYAWKTRNGLTVFSKDVETVLDEPQSLLIESVFPNDARIKIDVKVEPQRTYRVTCFLRTEGVGAQAIGANLSIWGTTNVSDDVRGTSGSWQKVEFYGTTAAGQKSMTVTLGLGGYGNLNFGKAWFTGFQVDRVDEVPAGARLNEFYTENEQPQSWLGTISNGILFWFAAGIALILLILLVLLLALNVGRWNGREARLLAGRPEIADPPFRPVRPRRIDAILMAVLTVLYLAVAFYDLGSTKVPKTYWEPVRVGESIEIGFDRPVDISRFSFYVGLGDGGFTLLGRAADGSWQEIKRIDFNEFDNCFTWGYRDVSFRTDAVRLKFDTFNAMLYEVAFFEKKADAGPEDPGTAFTGLRILSSDTEALDSGTPENLIDEQGFDQYVPSFRTGTYFDEIYHARTAYETLHRLNPYETTHPPLGKDIMALGVAIFGMNPFGWRVVGMLFGAAMVPILYLFGLRIFRRSLGGFLAAFLLMVDFMHFTQTRIATIDSYAVLFIILMYYFLYDYFVHRSYRLGFGRSLRALFFTGLFFGLGAAAKWISIYAAVGLGLVFFLAKWAEWRQYRRELDPRPPKPPRPKKARKAPSVAEDEAVETALAAEIADRPRPFAAWVKTYVRRHFNWTLLACVLFFAVIPAILYLASYIPYLQVRGNTLASVWDNQIYMYKYHSKDVLSATHDFASPWWSWPLLGRPMWFYDGQMLNASLKETIVTMGNPAIWWFGIVAFFGSIYVSIRKRDARMVPIYIAIVCQYVPWIFVKRVVFIYHFFSVVPFLILVIVHFLLHFWEKGPDHRLRRTLIVLYLVLAAGLFAMFYPAISGAPTTVDYVTNWLRWLPTWYF